jgi:hypothetical protein
MIKRDSQKKLPVGRTTAPYRWKWRIRCFVWSRRFVQMASALIESTGRHRSATIKHRMPLVVTRRSSSSSLDSSTTYHIHYYIHIQYTMSTATSASSEILRLVSSIALVQVACSLFSNYCFYRTEAYERAVAAVDRAQWNVKHEEQRLLLATTTTASATNNNNTRMTRANESLSQAVGKLAAFQLGPNLLNSIVFVVLLKVLGADLGGRVLAVLPFVPMRYLDKLTGRGLDFVESASALDLQSITDLKQASAFLFIYLLTNMSVKTYVHKLLAPSMPPGSESLQMEQVLKTLGFEMLPPTDNKAAEESTRPPSRNKVKSR